MTGRHLKAARVLAGLTQQQLADEAVVHCNSVKYWERSPRAHGYAVSQIIAALQRHGVECRDDQSGGKSRAIVIG